MDKHDIIIIGGGLSGLSVAHFLDRALPNADILILEQSGRAGGAVRSLHEQGFLAEWGAHGFLDNAPASRDLLAATGLDREAVKAPLGNFVRYICRHGRLVMIPQEPKKIIASHLLPLRHKLRILADLWIRPDEKDQPVGTWAARRFGSGVLPFVDAALTGTYAGDLNRLSIDAVMPGLRRLELENGSVIRGLIRRKKQAAGSKRRELPAMISFPGGMQRLPQALAANRNLRLETAAETISRTADGWQVQAGGQSWRADHLVLALTVNQTLALLCTSPPLNRTPPPVVEIPEARIATVALGFSEKARIPHGFGYLAPAAEQRFALGALFSTHMFPGRAPEGRQLIEALVGGRRHPERLELDDDTLVEETCRDLRQLIDLPEPPSYARVLRTGHGIPQLELGHPDLLAWRAALLAEQKNLHICGFGWEGIGINDMIRSAREVADDIATGTARSKAAEMKGVYF